MPKLKLQSARKTQAALTQVTDQLYEELRQSSLKHWLDDEKAAKTLDEKVHAWAYQAKSSLDQQHPYLDAQIHLEHWLDKVSVSAAEFQLMNQQFQDFQLALGTPALGELWQFQHNAAEPLPSKTLHLQFQLLKEKWQRKLTEAIAAWEFEQLALQRDAFLDEIKDFLAALQKMAKHKDAFGADTGIFIDYSKGQLTEHDVQQFEEWSRYLAQDQELMKLCKMMGSAVPSKYKRKRNSRIVQDAQQQLDQQAMEEITGIRLAQDLNLALPSELALLADPDLQILFDLKYLESNILGFHLQGEQTGRMIDDPRHAPRRRGEKGPMILCLDTSGSMHGQPELIAKAISLYLGMQAMKAKRPMHIINFSTNLTVLDLQRGYALDELIHFLSQSFHGGTDIVPAMQHAVDMLHQPNFSQADVLVISDFIMGALPAELMEQIEGHQQRGAGFYATAIGNFRIAHLGDALFDHQWIYQAATGRVTQLN
ncbi:VWA domain-containing protein [Acinetobacter pragensis]|uniref:VWA domain-containing protein n=1 Tax=Acinetobacter pragensis TaxID=1806892 RepID=UPI0033406DA6